MAKRTKADWTAEDLARQAAAAASLIEYLKDVDEDDDDLVQDSIEGETDFLETIDRVLEMEAEAVMMADALKERIAKMTARKKRFEDRKGWLRGILEMAMAQANGDRPLPFTLQTAAATVSLKTGRMTITVTDEALLPAMFWRTPDPVVDKAKLNEYVADVLDQADVTDDDADAKELPPGVEVTPPGVAVGIRRN